MKAKVKYFSALAFVLVLTVAVLPAVSMAQNPAPDRGPNEGQGPFNTLAIRGVILIGGTGAAPLGPVDIVIEGNRIASIRGAGTPGLPWYRVQ